ncbi:MAG: ABC transporter substrate-binding protein [bacterium]|nr:ABC transporter substrate-binding protein [bacterium]
MKKFLLPLLVLSLAACSGGEQGESDVIKIGYIGPMTGDAGSYGHDTKKGIDLYFQEHPTIQGKKVELIYEDAICNSQSAASAATKLVNIDQVKVIIGGQCSSETLGAAPVTEQHKVILISPVSSSPEVRDAGDYVFRMYPSDAIVGQTLAEEALKYERIAIITESTDYAEAYHDSVLHYLVQAQEVTPVVDEIVQPNTADFKTILQKVQNAKADVLLSIMQTPVKSGILVKQAAELGITAQIYGTDTLAGDDFEQHAKNAAKGVKMVIVAEDDSRAEVKEFKKVFGNFQAPVIFSLKSYDAAHVLADAIEAVGYDSDAIKQWLYDMPGREGLGGPIEFDEYGENNSQAGSVKVGVEDPATGRIVFELLREEP